MRNLLLLFSKYGTLILFLFLEAVSLFLIVNYNNKQKEIFLYSSNLFAGKVMARYDAVVDYFSLSTQNDSILQENARLLSYSLNMPANALSLDNLSDSTLRPYHIIPANICSKTIHMRNNRMTLDKGSEAGIMEGMGVISEKGIVGIIKKTNTQFSSVIPVINTQLQISAKILDKEYFGDLNWNPYDERYIQMKHVPKHASVMAGDTVITSGYSVIFPPGLRIGVIKEVKLPAGSNYYDLTVRLLNSLANLQHVYVLDYRLKNLKEEMIEEL